MFAAVLLLTVARSALAEVHYVDVNSTNATPPYTNWATAATNIQDAVDAAVAGDEVVVTNGIYATGGRAADIGSTSNRVVVDKPLSVRSVNGPQFTAIYGGFTQTQFGLLLSCWRCVRLTNNARLSGFTLTNGCSRVEGGGVYGGTLNNCILTRNGGQYCHAGGGAYGCTLNNCTLSHNTVSGDPSGTVGGHGGGAWGCTLNNCTLIGNSGGTGGGPEQCMLNNCTLVGNSAVVGGGARLSTLNNCVAYFNTASEAPNYDDAYSILNYSCTTPQPTSGSGNITDAPLFVDQAAGNLRLQPNSPCINAGNNSYVTIATDLDGNPRIAGGTVDIGAYEFQSPVSTISYAWLQQYGLPIDGLTDTADPDGDGADNYHEWLAGSDPTNPFSFAPLLTVIASGENLIFTWPTNAVGYTLQSTADLGPPAVWSTNSPAPVVVAGQNTVTNPITGAQQFYRLSQ